MPGNRTDRESDPTVSIRVGSPLLVAEGSIEIAGEPPVLTWFARGYLAFRYRTKGMSRFVRRMYS